MHIFKYSPRKGTKAAEMKRQIDGKIKEERSQKLIKLSDENQEKYNKKYIGKEIEVLWEEEKKGFYQGHTKNYILTIIKSQENLENKITKVKCVESYYDHIIAEMEKCNKTVTNA